ncbi:MAG: esterase family protein [Thermoleophilaceae bacterium]|nr:esterase family protein [Thermoleophilaceae bacterium]
MPSRLRQLTLASVLACAAWAAPAAAAEDPQVLGSQRLSPRLQELTLRTSELAGSTAVRVLLPAGYREHPARRYPVLYLLHGASGDQRSWTTEGQGDAESLTAALPLIVVMPNAGKGGFYTNWFNNGRGGTPRWENWHIKRLIPFIDGRYRTRAMGAGRAIAGLSMGGFGTFSYAARHPDLFTSALSLSGAVDTSTPPGVAPEIIDSISAADGGPPGSLWGPRATQEVRWRAHNPWDLAENLRGLALWLRTGNGQPGGPFGGGPDLDITEVGVAAQAFTVHQRLRELGIPHVFDDYGPGHHLWAYWNRGLRQTLPAIMARLRGGSRPPAKMTFTAAEPSYAAYGWGVRVKRPAMEFSRLAKAGRRGFSLSGSGSATVSTARLFVPRHAYRIVLHTPKGLVRRSLSASARGRLRISVPLGPGNPGQQFTAGATTRVFKTTVTIAPAG